MTICPACGTSNPNGARFCVSCGVSLVRGCPSCGTEVPAEARFCPSCGTPLFEDAAPPAGHERRLVTVLFADVTDSTALGERLDPERLQDVLATYFEAMREEIEGEGGTVEKFIGDAVMAAFGVPTAHEDDPARALRAALRMRTRLDEVNRLLADRHDVTLRIRTGVNTGEVLAATAPSPGDPMITGETVIVAARLQQDAEPGQIVVAERTARAARGFRFREPADRELRGKADVISAVVLEEETPERPQRGVPGLRAPMVGRDQELALFRTVYQRTVAERRPNLLTVYGDPGVGKSRLVREFLAWAEAQHPTPDVLFGRCLPYGDGATYWPLAEMLKRRAGVLDTDPPELAVEKVRKIGLDLLTADVTSDPVRATAALAYTVGLEDPDVSFADVDPREVRGELHAAWRSFFSALARQSPLIAVVEDIHWGDPVLLDLLEELAGRVEGRVLFVCPSRPDLTARRKGWGGGTRNASSVALDPLSAEESERLVRLLLSVDDLPGSVRTRILERAEGNPFFLEEIVRQLIDGGLIVRDGDRWRTSAGIDDVVIPDTVQGALAARIDLLDPSDKRILQAAAVVGRVFWPGPVADLGGASAEEVIGSFRTLEDRELVLSRGGSSLSGQPEYLFKHILTRDVAYESLPRVQRVSAHRAVAAWLERTAGDRAGEFAELIAHHLATAVSSSLAAGEPTDPELRASAIRWLLRASEDARRRLVLEKSRRLAQEALTLSANGLQRTDALESLGEATFVGYRGDEAWRFFREAAFTRAGAEPPDPARVAELCGRACEIPQRWPGSIRGSMPTEPEVLEVLDLGLKVLPPGDSRERVRLLGVRAGWPFAFPKTADDPTELLAYEAAGIEAAEMALRMGLVNLASGALDQANAAWSSIGWYGRAFPVWERRVGLAPQITDLLELGDCYAMGAWMSYELGRYTSAVEHAERGIELVAGQALNAELHLRAWRTAILFRLGRWDDALEEFGVARDMLEDDRRDDPPYFATHAFASAGFIHEARGDHDESGRLADMLFRIDPGRSARTYPTLLRLLIVRGDLDRASALPRPPSWRVHAGEAYESEIELVAARGAWPEAPALLVEARSHAEAAPAPSVLAFADRLEGRAAVAASDLERGTALLVAAAQAFATLGARWEAACTELAVAEARSTTGPPGDAERARMVFEELGSVRELARARALAEPGA